MAIPGIPTNYQIFNAEATKNLVYVVKITGAPSIITSIAPSTRVIFGDPAVKFGAGFVFGGLRPYTDVNGNPLYQALLDLDNSSISINQRIEPEQGKSTVATITLCFVDKDGYMTKLCSPGVVIPEILGAEVQLYAGYAQTSWPQDFYKIFRGYITQASIKTGKCTLQVSDANLKRRQQLFYCAQTTVTSSVLTTDTTIHVASTSGFFQPFINSTGGVDKAVVTYIGMNGEWIRTAPEGSSTTFTTYPDPSNPGSFLPMHRASRGTNAARGSIGDTINAAVQLTDDPMSMALKVMLSGWGGLPWITGVPVQSVGPFPDPAPFSTAADFIVLPVNVDAVNDYGLVIGDFLGVANSPNNPSAASGYKITGFSDQDGQPNRVINITPPLVKDSASGITAQFFSQFDTYPVDCGLQLTPKDVDVAGHLFIQSTFLGQAPGLLSFFITQVENSGKEWIEKQIYLPVGCFSVTKKGKLSVGISLPPLASTQLQILDQTNICNAQDLEVSRVINSRYFYNEIDYYFDVADDGSTYRTQDTDLDGPTFSTIGYASALTIQSNGLRTSTTQPVTPYDLNPGQQLTSAGIYVNFATSNLLSRFKTAAAPLTVKTTWQQGSLIEASDVVQLSDNGFLQLANFSNGTRNFGSQLMFVTERTLDLKSGSCTLSLILGFNTQLTDRFAVIAPATILGAGSTSSALILTDSFGSVFGVGNENQKWIGLEGLQITVHDTGYTTTGQTTFTGWDPLNPYRMLLSPALSFTPAAGYILELAPYATDSATDQQTAKNIYAYLNPTVTVVSGIDTSNFTVSSSDIGKFITNGPIRIHSADYTVDSGTTDNFVKTVDLVHNQITLKTPLSFTPAAGQHVDLIGFPDGLGPYRWI